MGFATPPTNPKIPGLAVNIHSVTVKFFEFSLGSLTTIKPVTQFDSKYLTQVIQTQILTEIKRMRYRMYNAVDKN